MNTLNGGIFNGGISKMVWRLALLACLFLWTGVAWAADDSLVLHYNFDGATDTTVPDQSGKTNAGQLHPYGGGLKVGPVVLKGTRGAALRLNGKTDYVLCPAGPGLPAQSFTLSLWLKTNGSASHQYVVSKYGWNIYLMAPNGVLNFENNTPEGGGVHNLPVKNIIPPKQWIFVTAVYDAERQTKEIYLNGKIENFAAGVRIAEHKDANFVMGSYLAYSQFFSGLLAEVKLYKRVLTADEISKQYENEKLLIDPDLSSEIPKTELASEPTLSKETYLGLERQPSKEPVAGVPSSLVLQNQQIRGEISPASGAITRMDSILKKAAIILGCEDIYIYDNKSISEGSDQAQGYRRSDPEKNAFELICSNPSLPGIEISKEYRLEDDRLIKTITFSGTSDEGAGKLIFLRSRLQMDAAFFKGGYFYRPMWDGGSGPASGTVPFLPESRVKERTRIADMQGSQSVFLQPGLGLGLAHYKFKVNGYWENDVTIARQHEIIKDDAYLEPGGWELYLTGDFIRKGAFLSCESHYLLFEGDAREFHRRYLELPGYAELVKTKVPDWYRRVKCIFTRQYMSLAQGGYYTSLVTESARKYISLMTEGECLMTIFTDWFLTGDYALDQKIEGPLKEYNSIPEDVKKNLAKYRALAPDKMKIGLYTWQGSVSKRSLVYMKEHPDWLLRSENGAIIGYDSGEQYNYLKNATTREHLDFIFNQYRKMMEYYETDLTYLDGGVGELVNFVPRKQYVHLYHSALLFNGIKRAAESAGKLHFSNGATRPDHSAAGFFELGEDHSQFDRKDWRIMANAYYLTKYCSPAGGGCVMYLNCQNDSNRQMMYGLKPQFGMLAYYQNLSHIFLDADICMEVADARIVDGDIIHPNWWKLETDTLESALLREGASWLLPLVHHGKEEKSEKVVVDVAKLGFKGDRPIYLWEQEVQTQYGLDWTAPMPDSIETMKLNFRVVPNNQPTLEVVAQLKPERLKVITLAQVPVFVYSVAGRRNNLFLAANRGVSVVGAFRGDKLVLETTSEVAQAELLAYLPGKYQSGEVKVNSQRVESQGMIFGKDRFIRFAIPKGHSKVEVTMNEKSEGEVVPLTSPCRNPYADNALGFYVEEGKPIIRAAVVDGKHCWEITGPGILANQFNHPFKGTDGIAFLIKNGPTPMADFSVIVASGSPLAGFVKKIPLAFSDWKPVQFTSSECDQKPEGAIWEQCPKFYFKIPIGMVYLSNFHFLPSQGKGTTAARRMTISRAKTAPQIDGSLEDECWKNAGTISFGEENQPDSTVIRAVYDDVNLYVAGICREPILNPPPKAKRNAGSICSAPDCEIFLAPGNDIKVYRFVTNPAAAQWNGAYRRGQIQEEWNSAWKVAAGIDWQAAWKFEMVIPFNDFGGKAPVKGDAWRGGFFRRCQAGAFGWQYKEGDHLLRPELNLGELIFGD